jgi:hypothetical protein
MECSLVRDPPGRNPAASTPRRTPTVAETFSRHFLGVLAEQRKMDGYISRNFHFETPRQIRTRATLFANVSLGPFLSAEALRSGNLLIILPWDRKGTVACRIRGARNVRRFGNA